MKNYTQRFISVVIFCICAAGINAQGGYDDPSSALALPITKISLFSSGLAYYEHTGTLNSPSVITLPFKPNAVNDALMSLVINDPSSANPSVYYQSPQTLLQTLRSLRIDLSDDPDIASILGRLRGAEIEITVPSLDGTPINGRILGVEYRPRMASLLGSQAFDPWLSLVTDQGIRMFSLMEIDSLNFKDPRIESDLARALNLIAASRNSQSRDLSVNLPGSGSRSVSLSYVIPSPVWKVSYRLDLGNGEGTSALFQGWAIVDNDGDADWDNIELSLVAGRPASFIQNLYPPYYISRPTLPLSIAGVAEAASYDQGYAPPPPAPAAAPRAAVEARPPPPMAMMEPQQYATAEDSEKILNLVGGVVETAAGAAAGDQFEFTVKHPVTINRQTSAMLPLVETAIEARKLLIFSGSNATGRNIHPRLGAQLGNTSGMKLPAGPITVYDGGTYAGDALIEFWNEGENRYISYGEDLSVTGTIMNSSARNMVSVTVYDGVMVFNRSQEFTKTYIFKNTSSQSKPLLIEHPKNQGTILESIEADEQTPTMYRFNVTLPEEQEFVLQVTESRPIMERISLLNIRPEILLSYASNNEIPANVRDALRQAADLWAAVNTAEAEVNETERQRSALAAEQDRIRRNLEAAGSQTPQGQEYLNRMLSIDNSIDELAPELERLRANVISARRALDDYLRSLNL